MACFIENPAQDLQIDLRVRLTMTPSGSTISINPTTGRTADPGSGGILARRARPGALSTVLYLVASVI
jgi:hypothetical protein